VPKPTPLSAWPGRIVRGLRRRFRDLYAVRWLKWRARRPRVPVGSAVRLHLGCGTVDLPGFINIDAAPHPHVHFLRNVAGEGLWPANSADLIYASHVLEHVPWARIPTVLGRWRDILKPGGVLRLSVPDFDALLEYYRETQDLAWITPPLMGGQFDAHDYHHAVFTRVSLESQLRAAGFSEVRAWEPDPKDARDWSMCKLRIRDRERYISVNLEAVK
jgi:predicted SAM-dependent methyltransferase